MKQNQMIITIVITVLVAAGGFFGGMKYQENKAPNFERQFGNGARMNGTNGGQTQNGNGTMMRNGGRQVMGEILSKDDTSITVKLPDGSSKIIFISNATTINKAQEATQGDLTVGATVAVFGTENTDKSVTATNIQLNPILRGTPGAASGSAK